MPDKDGRRRARPRARSGERKRIEQDRIELPVDLLAQQFARAEQAGLHGLRPDRQKFGRFLDAHAFDHPRDQDRAEDFGKIVDGPLDEPHDFALGHCTLGIVLSCLGGKRDDVRFRLGKRVERNSGGAQLAQAAEGLVDDDPGQPGRQSGVAAKLAEMAEGAQVGLLQGVLRLGVIAQNAARHPEQPTIVPAHDRPDGLGVARQSAANEIALAGAIGDHGRRMVRQGDWYHSRPPSAVGCAARKRVPGGGARASPRSRPPP